MSRACARTHTHSVPSTLAAALGDYEGGAVVLNHVTWSPLARFQHAASVAGPPSVVAYAEVEEDAQGVRRPPLAVSVGLSIALDG